MVNRIAMLGLAAFSAALAGCPDDLGKNVNGGVAGLQAPASLEGSTSPPGTEILLSWEDQATGETGYRLEISPGPFGTSGSAGTTYLYLPSGITFYRFSSQPHQTYYFRLVAVTETWESDPSNEIMVLTPYALTPPGPPRVRGLGNGAFTLTWNLVDGATGYLMEYSSDYGASWTPYPVQFGAGTYTAAISGLQRLVIYQVRVTALGPLGNSPPSGVVEFVIDS